MNLSMTNERVLLYAKCFLEEKINTYEEVLADKKVKGLQRNANERQLAIYKHDYELLKTFQFTDNNPK